MSNPLTGLALAAGGARGAYQAGALLALAEHGVRFNAVAGTSIGAINGAFYAQGDGSPGHLAGLVELWQSVPRAGILRLQGKAVAAALLALAARQTPTFLAWARAVAGDFSLLDPAPVAALLDRWLDYDTICRSRVDFSVALLREIDPLLDVLSGPWRRAEYCRAADLEPVELRAVLLAAGAIPFAFPSQVVGGRRYADAALADPLPARLLHEQGIRRVVSIFLADDPVQNRLDFPQTVLVQVRPSVDIYTGYLSTFDFSAGHIDRLIELGYRDAQANCAAAQDILGRLAIIQVQGRANQHLAAALPDRIELPGDDLGPEPRIR